MISFAAESLFWNPGDIFVVRPQNCDEQIADLFDLFAEHNFDFNERTVIRIEEIDSGRHVLFLIKFYLFILFNHQIHFRRLVSNHLRQRKICVFLMYSYMVEVPIRCRPLSLRQVFRV